ncbi:MAG TPA: hypothetical protein IAD15_08065 [Candidatus Fimiplasma intestinipullorum]|uniref:Integral membrane protein n=1 Tax=Candidatus Fimiplasma intestinipullorum TaxID=2840825 RepID=A0A9D1KZW8_9FIRM|nr:hypothetical protein [Candidatus Fimiplasma intestinipullorum]
MTKQMVYRLMIYLSGLLILALGLTLNTKAGLGVSAIISVSYCISLVLQLNFGDVTLGLYVVFVIIEMILHGIALKKQKSLKKTLVMDVLQIPLSIVFTRLLNLYGVFLPDQAMWLRLGVLLIAILLTGIGAAMSLNMRLIPNPGDGIVQAIADTFHKSVGFSKNMFDLVNITIAIVIGLSVVGELSGVGIGTVLAVIGVGRSIALFNHLTLHRLNELDGLNAAS